MEKMLVLAVFLAAVGHNEGYKILVAPLFTGFNSHMLNMEHMADILALDGHQVSVLLNDKVLDYKTTKYADIISFQVTQNVTDFGDMTIDDMQFGGFAVAETIYRMVSLQGLFCDSLFRDKVVMNHLRESKFDLIIADKFSVCNFGLISHLNITSIWVQITGFFIDSFGSYPQFPSVTCLVAGSVCDSDEMTFTQRALNTALLMAFNYYFLPRHFIPAQHRVAEGAGVDLKVSLESILTDRVIVIPSVDFVLDTPRPTMPHVFPIAGLHLKPPQPLPTYFQNIIDKSGDDGVIVMSFGTLVPKFNTQKAEIFARVFGKLKQQVIWRFTGATPKSLQNNTHIVKWFPQTDLLANPAVKIFISQCGLFSVYEMAYHAVPVIAIPLIFEQHHHAMKLTQRVKMGIKLEYQTLTDDELENAIHEILTNPMYHENAQRASGVTADRPMSPAHEFRHLVNMTIRTGGAKHLFHPYAATMHWITFYGIDVFLLFFGITVFILYCFVCVLRRMFRLLCETQVKFKKM